jgi:hypothetical protein
MTLPQALWRPEMKIRIYAVLPDTAEGQMDAVSGVFKITQAEELGIAIANVALLWPDWKELSIERITSPD